MGYSNLAAILVLSCAAFSNAKSPGFFFGGRFMGNCGPDGYYYGDATHFVQCIGGKPFEMLCAPGTENSPLKEYKHGYYVSVSIFCDVNLNDAQNSPPAQKVEEDVTMMEKGDGDVMAAEEEEKEDVMPAEEEQGKLLYVPDDVPVEEAESSESDSSEESSEEESSEESSEEEELSEEMPKPVDLSIAPPSKSGYFYRPYFAGFPYKSFYPYAPAAFPYDNPYYARYL